MFPDATRASNPTYRSRMLLPSSSFQLRRLEDQPRLKLKHARRVDIRKRRNRIRRRSHTTDKLSKRRRRYQAITVSRHSASQKVAMIEEIETFQSEQQSEAF